MGRFKIKNILDFYKYIDANILEHSDTINLKIDIDDVSDNDKYQIQFIVDCLNYTIRCGELSSFITYCDGTSYPNIENLSNEDVNILKSCVDCIENLYIKAHINNLLFIKTKTKNKIDFAKEAIDSYFELIKKDFINPEENWSKIQLTFNNLAVLAYKSKYRTEDFKNLSIEIAKTSNIKVLVSDAIEFLIEKVKKRKLKKKVLKGLINRCKYFIKNNDDNIRWTEAFIKYGRQISTINQTNLQQWDILQAKAYEKEMKQLVKFGNNEMIASSWCKDAIEYYKKAKAKTKVEKLYQKYDILCKNIELQAIKGPVIDLSENIAKIKDYISISSELDVVKGLVLYFTPKYQINKMHAEKRKAESFFSNYFPVNYTDIYGQVVGYAHTDEELFKHNLFEIYKNDIHLNTKLLFYYINYAIEKNKLTASNLIQFFKNTWFGKIIQKSVSNNETLAYQWLEHIEEPIKNFCNKHKQFQENKLYNLSFINETDTLTLKIEGIVRDIVEFAKIKSFNVRKFKKDSEGREISEWRSINDLLWDPKIFEILNEDDVWFMRFFVTDSIDLRNNIAHCLVLSPYQEQYYCGIYWLIIVLLRLSQILE
ncbi:DUF4209 domain-containing protein [bacterium]|nr:DUF4209 domain-containing protein [bacterium]